MHDKAMNKGLRTNDKSYQALKEEPRCIFTSYKYIFFLVFLLIIILF